MKKYETMTISEFMNRTQVEVKKFHINKNLVIKVIGTTALIFVAGGSFNYAFASSGIDIEAGKLYKELIGIGKWVIIFKGGIDIVKSIGNGDIDSAKKNFFGYLLTYLFLLGLPYGMTKVDEVFSGLNK